jgi:hypothetical protein
MTFGRLAGAEIAQNLGKPQGEVGGQSIKEEVEAKRSDSVMLMEKDLLIGEGRTAEVSWVRGLIDLNVSVWQYCWS